MSTLKLKVKIKAGNKITYVGSCTIMNLFIWYEHQTSGSYFFPVYAKDANKFRYLISALVLIFRLLPEKKVWEKNDSN